MKELISTDRTPEELKKENEKLKDEIELKDDQLKPKIYLFLLWDSTIQVQDAIIQAQKKEIDILKKR